jgi:hypothetical protein
MLQANRFRTILNVSFWIFSGLLVTAILHLGVAKLRGQQPAATPSPYTTILSNTVVEPEGASTHSSDVTTAVRSDGAHLMRLERRIGTAMAARTIHLPSGEQILVDDVHELKSTTSDKQRNPGMWVRDPKLKCLLPSVQGEKLLGVEVVHGHRSAKVQYQSLTSWFSLDVGCAMLRSVADWGDRGATHQDLKSLVTGEPAGDLFRVPQSYREVPPSELRRAGTNHLADSRTEARLSKADEWYFTHRPH